MGSRVGKRYARALFHLVHSEMPRTIGIADALTAIAGLFDTAEIAKVLKSPVIPDSLKREVVRYGFEKTGADPVLKSFVEHIISAGRLAALPEIAAGFEGLVNHARGIVTAEVKTASGLTESEQSELQAALEKKLNKKVQIHASVNPHVIGGVWIGIGHSVIDLTVRSQVDALIHDVISEG